MSDIVQRLRAIVKTGADPCRDDYIAAMDEAADEIERLRGVVGRQMAESRQQFDDAEQESADLAITDEENMNQLETLRVIIDGDRLDIQVSVDLAGLRKLIGVLEKYESVLTDARGILKTEGKWGTEIK